MPVKHQFISLVLVSLLPFLFILKEGISVGSLASLTGFIGATLFFWQLILGNRFLVSRFTKDVIAVNSAHKFLGTYGTIFVLFHPLLMMLSYSQNLNFILRLSFADPFELQVSLGRVALFTFIAIWVSSAILRQKLIYRPWLYIHYLAYPLMGLVLLHARNIGSNLNSLPVLGSYWQILMGAYVLLILYRLAKWAGLGKTAYRLKYIVKLSDEVYQYTLAPIGGSIRPEVGQYTYLQTRRFGEAHPFTVMEFNQKSGTITFGIKAEGPYTKSLPGLSENATVFIDGPYGVFTKEGHNPKPKVLIAAGIGITPFVDLIHKFATEDTYLFYANKTLKDAVRRAELKQHLKSNYFDSVTQEKVAGLHIISGRLDAEIIKSKIPANIWPKANYFLCGPKPFYLSLSQGLKDLGVKPHHIHYEAFGL